MDTAPRWIAYIAVDDLPDAEENPKAHDLDMLEASMRRFGFTEAPMLDERTGRLVAGHGRKERLIDARDAGEDPPDGVVVDDDGRWLVPVQRGWASTDDADARAYVVASNRLAEAGGWLPSLGPYLAELAELPDGLTGVGFDQIDVGLILDELAGITPPEPGASEREHVEFDANKAKTTTCPKCGHEWLRQD